MNQRTAPDNLKMIIGDNLQEIPVHEDGFLPILVKDDSTEWHPSHDIPPHWHEEIEMTYIMEGTGEYTVNGIPCALPTGSVIMVPPNVLHAARYSKRYHTAVFLIHPNIFSSHEVYIQQYLRILESRDHAFYLFDGSLPWHSEIKSECARLFEACLGREYAYEPIALSCVYRILGILGQNHLLEQENTHGPIYKRNELDSLRIMMTYVQDHYAEPITVDSLAVAASVSRSTCDKLFRKIINQSPTDYVIYIRLTQSMRLLQQGLPVTEIADACGFRSLSYYSRLFKARTGLTPTAYQRAHLQ